jgi:hypothetical protein
MRESRDDAVIAAANWRQTGAVSIARFLAKGNGRFFEGPMMEHLPVWVSLGIDPVEETCIVMGFATNEKDAQENDKRTKECSDYRRIRRIT